MYTEEIKFFENFTDTVLWQICCWSTQNWILYNSVCLSTVMALAATIKSRQCLWKRDFWGCSEVSGFSGAAVCSLQIFTGIQTENFSSKGWSPYFTSSISFPNEPLISWTFWLTPGFSDFPTALLERRHHRWSLKGNQVFMCMKGNSLDVPGNRL